MKQPLRITSRANPTVLYAASLKDKKHRDANCAFLIEGYKLLEEAISASLPITHIFIEEGKDAYFEGICSLLKRNNMENVEIFFLSRPCIEKISTEKAPQGVIAVSKHLDFFARSIKIYMKDISSDSHILALASVRDPSNLGAIVRSAVAFGADTVLLSSDCAELYNPKTLRAAMGCIFKMRVLIVEDFADAVKVLRSLGRRVYAAELTENASALSELGVRRSDVYIIGNEGHGIEKDISVLCTGSVYIPITSGAESLNAAVAASILLWEQYIHG